MGIRLSRVLDILITRFILSVAISWMVGGVRLHAEATGPQTADAGPSDVPSAPREFRGVWIATVANIDWPSQPGLPSDKQQEELRQLLDQAARIHLNAVILQVRPAADALYESNLEPWSRFLTGEMGKPPSEPYDPLSFAVAEAHQRGLELHAWFNPYRALHLSSRSSVSENHVSKTHPDWVRTYGNFLWLDPGEPEAVNHSIAVMMDVLRRYDIDGVHLDDYFYPYPIQDDAGRNIPFPDDSSWARAIDHLDPASGPMPSRDDWRRQNVDRFIERLYREIKEAKPWVKFGISPFGIWRPGHPEQIKGFDQYSQLYADARKWIREGWLDYATPQLYWRIDPPDQSYPVLLKWWHEQNHKQRHLWPGNFTSRLRSRRSGDWTADEILAQIDRTRNQIGATGNIHFSMKVLSENADAIADRLLAGPYKPKALVPASDWLASSETPRPSKPIVQIDDQNVAFVLRMLPTQVQKSWLYVVRYQYGGLWHIDIVSGQQTEYSLDRESAAGPLSNIAISAVNRIGQEGPIALISMEDH
ncbi:MAG: family 10 glycosylhydrolase [Pirellulales bacterium]|nr:family 10 glycosylhydrolase [Pirellulales bacterium]